MSYARTAQLNCMRAQAGGALHVEGQAAVAIDSTVIANCSAVSASSWAVRALHIVGPTVGGGQDYSVGHRKAAAGISSGGNSSSWEMMSICGCGGFE